MVLRPGFKHRVHISRFNIKGFGVKGLGFRVKG
jgi:hypothetical protein